MRVWKSGDTSHSIKRDQVDLIEVRFEQHLVGDDVIDLTGTWEEQPCR